MDFLGTRTGTEENVLKFTVTENNIKSPQGRRHTDWGPGSDRGPFTLSYYFE